LGNKNSLQINNLHESDSVVTGIVRRQALCDGLVEFSARAGIGFAHG